ncbi:uncharacterized protein LOC130894446 [Diorhabda carinulata]|uniref:uncharacterized protein LOC130894446 n=1 Tax=Diorhabda carinulata TaxID=1163345 RepID=UPI0025A26435|nr:uncharacterized protein LOC130894446 [Diorhabda carinulata]
MSSETCIESIRDIQTILKNKLDIEKITKIDITRLTAPGENYGSLILKLDIYLNSVNSVDEEIVKLVAKKIPVEQILRENFNIQITFKNEVGLYETVLPILQDFQRSHGIQNVINSVPKFFGARLNLDGNEEVTEDAVIILENLTAKGFSNVERTTGFNLESTKLILENLAEFHAVPLALKLKQPKLFERLKKFCNTFEFKSEFHKIFWETTRAVIKEKPTCALLDNKIKLLGQIDRPEVMEPFGTLVHDDLWSNNTMQKFAPNQIAVENKFLDFQFLDYGSPASDFLFFVFTSVQLDVLENNLDILISTYHNRFLKHLEVFGCDIGVFTAEKFIEEIKRETAFQIGHIINFVLFIIKTKQENVKILDHINIKPSLITQKAKEHIWFVIEEWNRRGWL